ncbi:diaminopimelate decarboxylase [Methanobrevibacter boviskoreani]|uniref:diaminopimelate decarboxylase n=2 Tax=Methanobrevibacter TaxID=2172 RepID=UPI0023A8CB8E|nr:diaminopimelate decarboxylase [Methanobrevibacter boviskoreani]MCI6930302.1 diaminopimelate decarboxylase [Methanobrevibacter boviskoreani]MDD6256996.1 diaminopimelate decarboxylase [Methanobrevibacter boviskoreani]
MDLNIKVNDKDHLDIGGADAVDIANEFGTPVYAIDENRIRDNYNRFYNAFSKYYPDFKVFYACKANTNLAVMKILESEGCCVDTVSPGEVYISEKLGFSPDRILFTGNNITNEELKMVHDMGVILNVDSRSALKRLAEVVDPKGLKVSIRVNPMVGAGHHEHTITGGVMSKFGIMDNEATEVYKLAQDLGFNPIGIHSHIGSGILDPEPFKLAIGSTMDIAGKVHDDLGIDFEFVDFGGGIGVPYTPDEKALDIDHFAHENVEFFKGKLKEYNMKNPTMFLEPGRYIVADAVTLLVQVNSVKQSYRKYIGVDAGFNTLLRPCMYGSYHHIVDASKMSAPITQEVDVAGDVCESGDLFARDRPLPDIEEGDILGILNSGAYGFTMASNYNSRPLPAEVLIKDGNPTLVRKAQTFDDLFRNQIIPDYLQ